MDFHREIIGVLVILVILVVSFGELVSLSFGESVSGNGRRLQIQSERGSALVLPLVELKRNGGDMDRRFTERRRRLEYEAESEEARMTLHDDLLTKGDRVMHMFTNIFPTVISVTGLQKNAGLSRLSGKVFLRDGSPFFDFKNNIGQDGKLHENDGDGYYMWLRSYTSVRYYTSRVFIGSPPQEFALIVDTGSTVTYVPCSTCTHCGHHQDPRFVPDNSSSYQPVACDSQDCITDMCDKNHQCKYERMYAEMSSSKGVLGKDHLGFGPTSRLSPQSLLFGCETAETGDLYLQHADGIMGLGRGPLSIVDQLVGNGVMEDSFSLCYGGMDEGGGSMVLGAIPAPQGMVFAKSDPERSSYYNLDLSEIQVQGVSLKLESKVFNGKYGTIIDSGTTYAYLPNGAFEAFRDAIIQQLGSLQAVGGPDPNYPDICYAGAGTDTKELGKHFPPVDFVFAGNKKVFLAPENYLFKHSKVPGAYCLGFFKNVDATTLLGGIVVRNMLVTYDRFNQQIGFLRTNCTDLWSILPAEAPLRPPPAVSPVNENHSPVESPIAPPPSTQSPAHSPEAEQIFVSIELLIALAANITIFSSEIPLFISSISSQLAVLPSQISIGEIKEEEGHVVVRCIISAASSNHFTSSSAKALAVKFEEHTIQLPEIFGAYHLRSWKGLPPSEWDWIHSEKVKVGVVITVLVGVVIMLAVVASLAYWYFAKYRNRDQIKYNNLDEVEANEGETLIGDQQL